MIIALSCIYTLLMLLFTLAFLVDWIRSRKKIKKYSKYGIWVGLSIIALDVLMFIFGLKMSVYMMLTSLLAIPIEQIRLIGFTMLGMYYAAEIGVPSFPLLLKKFKIPMEDKLEKVIPDIETGKLPEEALDVDPALLSDKNEGIISPRNDVLLSVPMKEYLVKVIGIGVICILYSAILFLITKPHISQLVQQLFGLPTENVENTTTVYLVFALIEVSIVEEIVFRLGIQNFLVKHLKLENNKYWIAILITSAIWTLGHTGVIDPQWVKFVQIFPIGLLLGWMNKKFGVESTIIAHMMMNLVLTPLAGYLIG